MTLRILAIDPGTDKSGWIVLHDGVPFSCGISPNANVFRDANMWQAWPPDNTPLVAIEDIRSYGQAVGQSTLDTCMWVGRFVQSWYGTNQVPTLGELRQKGVLIPRKEVLLHVCNRGNKVTDANVRRAMLDRFGGDDADRAKSRNRDEGPLYMIRKNGGSHIWSALAIGVTRFDRHVSAQTQAVSTNVIPLNKAQSFLAARGYNV